MQGRALQQRCSGRGACGVAAPFRNLTPCLAPRSALGTGRPAAKMVVMAATFAPPTVATTKLAFMENYKRPIPGIFSTVLQELLVQQHFMRYAINYEYNEVFALGVVSVFEQILESLSDKERTEIFNAFIKSLKEDPDMYRRDAAALEKAASALPSSEKLVPGDNSEVQKTLAKIAEKANSGKLAYNKFFAIGLFRLLEITGAKEPSALEALVKAVGVKPEAVSRDLTLYKGILSKLSVAKELMRDFMDREKKKQLEREAEKAQRAAKELAGEQA